MTFTRTLFSIAALSIAFSVTSTWSATGNQHSVRTTTIQIAEATSGNQGMGMRTGDTTPGYTDHMKAMQELHDKMQTDTTTEERNALMAEQMELMQKGMNMMGGMGSGSGMGNAEDMPARQSMMEERMDIMQMMMQMMMDRTQSVPTTK